MLERNRQQRLRQYGERRERDWAEALARETQLVTALKARSRTPLHHPCHRAMRKHTGACAVNRLHKGHLSFCVWAAQDE